MGNAPYSTCGTSFARHLHADESRAEICAAGNNTVYLSVYDLNEDWLQANNLFRNVLHIGGAFHTGVEVYGREWSYGQEGVSSIQPRRHEVHIFRQSVYMGMTTKTPAEVIELLQIEVMPRWTGSDYDILRRNCCSFADFLCGRLVRKHIPGWVNRFPKVASAASRGLGKVMDFGGSVSNAASHSGCSASCGRSVRSWRSPHSRNDARHLGRSLSVVSGQSEASVTTVASPASTSPASSEPSSPRSPRWSGDHLEAEHGEDLRPFRW